MELLIVDTLILAIIVAGAGGAFSAFLGWLNSDELFDARKFSNGIIRGAIGGAMLAIVIDVEITTRVLVVLFFSALGSDIIGNRVVKAVKKENSRRK